MEKQKNYCIFAHILDENADGVQVGTDYTTKEILEIIEFIEKNYL